MRLAGASALLVAAGLGFGFYGLVSPSHVQPPRPHGSEVWAFQSASPAAVGSSASPLAKRSIARLSTSSRLVSPPVSVASPPVRVTIAGLGISSSLGPALALKANGTVADAPLSGPTWSLPWWYKAGPAPGQAGSAVILGHVDSALGAGHLGAFFRLGAAVPGDRVTVTSADGSITAWSVTSVRLYPDQQFPDAHVYARSGPPTLRLVTCGGAFDYQSHAYQSAVVVSARLVSAV